MERVHPRDLLRRQEVQVDERSAHGYRREVLEPKVRPRPPSVARGGRLCDEVGLDADAEALVALLCVEAGLVREGVPTSVCMYVYMFAEAGLVEEGVLCP